MCILSTLSLKKIGNFPLKRKIRKSPLKSDRQERPPQGGFFLSKLTICFFWIRIRTMQSIELRSNLRLELSLGVDRLTSTIFGFNVVRNSQTENSPADEVHCREDGVVIYTLGQKDRPIGKRFIPSSSVEE